MALGTTIDNNGYFSGMIDLADSTLVAIEMPATWTGTQITFQAKTSRGAGNDIEDIETWKDVYNDAGTEVTITVAANRIVGIATAVLKDALGPLRYIRLRAGTAAAPQGQSPSKQLKLITK